MAVTGPILANLPEGCYRQPTETDGLDEQGNRTKTIVVKGKYASTDVLLKTLSKGCLVVAGWTLSNATLARQNGAGLLSINCIPDAGTETDKEGNAVQKSIKETWTLKAVRNDKSILAYCGSGSAPSRALVEAWMKEPDGALAARMAFTRADGSICDIQNMQGSEYSDLQNTAVSTVDLIGKIMKGIDSVMRFYPLLTKTTVYPTPPAKVYQNLSTIDKPSFGMTAERVAPGNITDIIDAHTWVKCQDDYAQTADGNHSRIESWLGSTDDVDVNLYGAESDRWPMPYKHNEGGGAV